MVTTIDVLTPAEQLLSSYGITQPNQIDLEAIAFDRGASVKYRPLDGCEARLVAGPERAVITVNTRDSSPGRQRFSLGHELAHWLCDRRTGGFLCAQADIGPQNAEAKSIESLANAYASQLILPTYLVDPWLASRSPTLSLAKALATEFSASRTAATIKLVKRTGEVACLLCHTQSGLIWHQRSPRFPAEYYVLPELHHDTAAFGMVFGGLAAGRARREPASRWLSGPDTARREVTVESIGLPASKVLTLLVVGR